MYALNHTCTQTYENLVKHARTQTLAQTVTRLCAALINTQTQTRTRDCKIMTLYIIIYTSISTTFCDYNYDYGKKS